jgi:hypothetical protein
MENVNEYKINLRERESGNFNFATRPLEEGEKKYYGIFISHSSADNDKYLFPLRERMIERGLYPLCDRDFLSGGDRFQMKIEQTLDCYAAVIIVTEASLSSDWVNYEIGILSGRGIPIYIFDPTGVLERAGGKCGAYRDFHVEGFAPTYRTFDELLLALGEASPYSDMFSEENAFLDTATFRKRMNERVETVIATLSSPIFEEHYSMFAECRVGMLIPNFGMFYDGHADGERCFAQRGAPLEGGVCPHSGLHCALHPSRVLDEENKECVLLNHTLYNGKLLRCGELDRRGIPMPKTSLVFHLPLHRYYGTEFKFIIDVPDNRHYDTIMSLLESAGMNPSGPASMVGGRIYISLPSRKPQGLFRLVHEFKNNYLCPHAGRRAK